MLDFFDLLSNPSYDVKYYEGQNNGGFLDWQTWRKPRGCNYVYIMCVGGGASGGTGINTTTTSGGGPGGSPGGSITYLVPSMFLPDVLYIQSGSGVTGPTTSGNGGIVGINSYVAFEPQTSQSNTLTLLYASGGGISATVANSTTGGVSGSGGAGVVGTVGGKGIFSAPFISGGSNGGTSASNGVAQAIKVATMTCGGGGGGGTSGATTFSGGNTSSSSSTNGGEFFSNPNNLGGIGASGVTPAGNGVNGLKTPKFLFNYGGSGGGGASATSGGIAGFGGDGAPGCGGGGGGGATTTNPTIGAGGAGGPGFVYIISF